MEYTKSQLMKIKHNDSYYLFTCANKKYVTKNKKSAEILIDLIHMAIEPISLKSLENQMLRKIDPNQADILTILIDLAIEKKFLVQKPVKHTNPLYIKNELYFDFFEKGKTTQTLKQKHILIIGCGGIGNHISYHLSSYGIGKLTLLDDDIIEESNLNRQFLFTRQDIGKKKVACLSSALKDRNIETQIISLDIRLSTYLDTLAVIEEKYDMVILSADEPNEIIYWVNKACFSKNIPFINVGYSGDKALVGPLIIPNKTGCFQCMSRVEDLDHELIKINEINSKYSPPSSPSLNGIASSIASDEIVRFLMGETSISVISKRIVLLTKDKSIDFVPFHKNENCEVCSI